MKKIYLLLLTVFAFTAIINAQSTANYSFATNTTGSLTDMSSGTTQLIAANTDDGASSVTNIGFTFFFQGAAYSQFSVNSNGSIRLGATAISTTAYDPLAQAGASIITAYGADQRTHTSGKVHFKVTGSAPNRILIIEWLNMQADFNSGGTADLTYQVRLAESTGVIEFIYGSMTMSANGASDTNSNTPQIGFSSNSTANNVGSVTAPQSGTPAPTYNGTSATVATNTYTTGTIPVLTSAANGSRRVFTFTPPVPSAPTGLSFTAVTPVGMTLNWTDNASNEVGYVIFRSDDGGTTYNLVSQTAANAVSSAQSTLTPGTNYFWRVYAVSEGALSSPVLQGSQSTLPPGNITSITSGLWSQTSTWSTGTIPTNTDNVTIANGHTVTIDVAAVSYTLTVASGGTLQYEQTTARTLTVSNNVTISSGGTFQSNPAGTVTTHVLSIGGNLTNNGTLDFSTNTETAGAGITFTGAANNTFSGTGAVTDIRTLTINKGTSSANILELNPTNFTVQGTTTDGAPMAFLTLTNGTLKVSGTFTLNARVFTSAGYTIPATGGFWLNNPNFTVAGQNGSPTVAGLFRMTQGTFNIGTATGNSMGFSTGSTIIVEGGAINAAGRFGVAAAANAITYTQSNGTITVCTIGNTSGTLGSFDLGTSLSSAITMTGGTIVNQLSATTIDYRNQAGSGITGVTGGTLQLGNASSGSAKTFSIRGVVPNLVLTNTSANHSASWSTTLVNYNNISLNITINPGTILNLANAVFLFYGTTLTNNGTLTHNGASSNFVTFLDTAPQFYTGTGVVTAPMSNIAFQSTISFTFDPSSPAIVANAVRLFTGNVINSDKLIVGNGGSTTAVIQVGNTTTPTDAGTFDKQLAFNPGTGGTTLSYLRTVNTRTTGFEVPASRTVTSMTYDDNDGTHTLALAGGDITLAGTGTALTLTNGRIVTGSNNLILSSGSATVSRTNGYVDGNLRKNLAAAASKTFEVGTANGYSPATVNATAGTFPTDVTVKPVQATQPVLDPNNSLKRYWTITASGITANLTFNYLAGDVSGTEANYKVAKVESGVATSFPGSTVNTGTHVGSVTGITSFSDWTLAEPCTGATGGTASGTTAFCGPGTPTITASGYSSGAGFQYQWQSSNDNFATNIVDIAGQTNPAALTTGLVSATTYYRLKVTCPFGPAIDYSNIVTVTINTAPSATISYGGTPYCSNAGTANVTQTGTTGGTYSSAAGLSINSTTGAINLGASTPGTYTVTYGFAATACPAANFTTSVTITAAPNATISYPGSPYCNTSLTAAVTQTGTTGGTYTSTAGLLINATTGQVDLYNSTAGTYTVTYTIAAAGGCAAFSTTASITINICPPSAVTVTATAGTAGPSGYNTLKLAFDAINAGTHMGNIIVNINNSTTEGATPAVLNSSGTGSASYTSVNIRPTADGLSISGGTIPTLRGVIELNGADNVTIDGDNPNTAGTNRNLTITLTGTTTSSAVIWIKSASAADGATNNTIKNCIIAGQSNANTTIGLLGGSSTFGNAADIGNSNITIDNNAFLRTQNGIYWNGFATAPNYDANLVISNNNFGSTVAADKHIFRGMILQNVSNFTVSGNTIQGISSTTTSISNMSGIQLFGGSNGGNIFNNKISDIKQNNTTGYGAEGINLGFTTNTAGVNVYNNFISDIAGRGWLGTSTATNGFSPSDNGYGIAISNGGGYNIYYNTVHMNTNQTNNGNPAALLINESPIPATPPANSFNIRNNIFTNSQTTGTNRFSVIGVHANTTFTDINYNDYYTTGPNLGNFGGTNQANLAAWKTATGKDANSVNAVPTFVSGTDLHLSTTGNCALDGTATPIATYTTDIDGQTRNATTPDIGADEFTSAPRTATIAYTATPYCVSGGTATVTQTGTTGGTYTAPAGVSINATTGAINLGASTAGTYTITYTLAALGACPVVTATTSITINAAPSATISYAGSPYCQNAGTANVTQTGSTGGTYSSTTGLTINATTGAVTLGTSTPGTYTVTYTIAAANGCATYTTTTTITITAPPTATISYTGSPYCQNAGVANVTQTGSTGGTYTSTAGLSINASTGAVTLGTSTPGTYTVTYTVAAAGGCAAFTTTASITITATPNATISYTGSPYCQNAGTANVTRTGTAGGTYSSTTGLSINTTTGAVTLGTSTPGTYTVTYTVAAAGGCATYTTTTTITITTPPSATISYAGSPYCGTGTATVTRTGTAGGTYSSTAGISLNASTGDVNLTTSTPGTYTVTYTVAAAGGCAVYTTTTSITINTTSVAPTGATTSVSVNCGPANGVVLSVTGGSLGTGASWKWYTGSCGGTAVGTGATLTLNVGATTTYYVRAEGTCNTTTCASVTVTINPQPTISLAAAPYTSLMPGWTTTLTATIAPVVAGNVIVWYRDGVVVPGATGNSINVTVDELGSYTARVTSPFSCTALSAALLIKDSATDKLFISPNPNSGRFKIRYYTSAHNFGFLRTVLIYDEKGAIVYNKRLPITAPYSSMDINMTNAAKGIYMVVLADHEGKPMAQGKVVIQ